MANFRWINQGGFDEVSRSAPPDPATVLFTLAAAGRNPADITLPTAGDKESVEGTTTRSWQAPRLARRIRRQPRRVPPRIRGQLSPPAPAAPPTLSPADDPPPAQGSHEGPSMRAALPEGLVTGFVTSLRASVVEFFSRDAASEYDAATDTWDKLDAAKETPFSTGFTTMV